VVEVRALAALSASLLVLAGCADDGPSSRPPAPTPTEALWNPCDALDETQVSKALDATLTMEVGTPTAPACAFTPDLEGGPVVDANYMLFPEGLDAVFESMTELDPEDVREVKVAGADAARVVVDFDDIQLFVSGFVQNGDLIQTVDVVDPQPYDEQRAVRGVRMILTKFSKAAPDEAGASNGR
jgi:hypothetical protein